MSEENNVMLEEIPVESTPSDSMPIAPKKKRGFFRFNGETSTVVNLAHVTNMTLEGKKITFNFYSTSIFVELVDEAAATSVYDVILNEWTAE